MQTIKIRCLALVVLTALAVSAFIAGIQSGQAQKQSAAFSPTIPKARKAQRPPIIDMHMHAERAAEFGTVGLKACPGDVRKTFPAADPREVVPSDQLEDCPNPIYAPKTDAGVFEATRALIEKYNLTGVVSGEPALVKQWGDKLGNRLIPGILFYKPADIEIGRLRALIERKEVQIIGEIGLQYAGLSPADPVVEPYWALAEELDIPVGIHMGLGPPGSADHWGQQNYRARLTNPLLLEDVLVRHPKLRVYVMHAGWPMLDEMVHMLYTYPRLYVDTGVIDWYLPRKEFHQYLRRLVEAGFGDRIMFGSDQMIWPQAIEVGIQAIESADFLTARQKRDIFYHNAARFLRLPSGQQRGK